MFVHVVLFWIKADAPADAQERLAADCRAYLSAIPGLEYFDVGRPAMTPRDVVDNSYSVGLLTVFKDKAGYDVYAPHPKHLAFIERNKAHWDRVRVYDFV